ncbi:MAG: L,D-transpeptidase/peptidoglycan binding protein [Eubacterium sp.]|nr:L,D-transpeptidase/peptidoglycan binding protein [Eubacterium sp.]
MKRLSRNLVSMLMLLILLILILAGVYAFGIYHFKTHFFTGSKINGVSIGEMTADDARYAIQNQIRRYTITCVERNNLTEKLTGDQFYMQYKDDGMIETLLQKQNPYLWVFYLGHGKDYQIDVGYTYEKEAVDKVLDEMKAFSSEYAVAPASARVVDDGAQFVVADCDQGALPNREKVRRALIKAIENGDRTVDFDKEDLYEHPAKAGDNSKLQQEAENINKVLQSNITYDMVDRSFTINGDNIRNFIEQTDNGGFKLSRDKIAGFVKDMAFQTDTYGLKHKFTTHSGRQIVLQAGGDYGWCINQEETTTDLYNAILNGETGNREPIYLFKALNRSSDDIGNTYVEICIEKQEMWCYKDGVCVVDTPVVTGNHSKGEDTPSGCVWAVDAKESPATFEDNGGVKVKFWLPFVDSCGIHDASWRSAGEYGGTTWKMRGSNGCINTPLDAAEQIYGIISIGYPVIVYYSEDQVVGTQPTHEVVPG